MSNPSTFEAEGVTIGVTSQDVLTDMSDMLLETYAIYLFPPITCIRIIKNTKK